jgi:beta-1,2-mannosidase
MKKLLSLLFIFLFLGCQSIPQQAKPIPLEKKDWAMVDFVKVDSINPILVPESSQTFSSPISNKSVQWEQRNVLNPSAVVRENKVYLIYRAQDSEMTSRLGLAISEDGLHFKKQEKPIFYPDNDTMKDYEWKGGVEDPRIVEREDGIYIMTYTAYDGKVARLCLASSKDLKTWTKHGLVLNEERYKDLWSKSGAIVCKQEGNKLIAAKIKNKYWMYFGDTDLYIASSDDLIHWEVALNEETQKMISVLHPRMGYFDSRLVESGPFALLQNQGIVLIYNGSNATNYNDPKLPKFTYAAGQALFDKENPYKMIDRLDTYFIHPDKPYEKTGEVNEVCFVEGLVFFKNKWFLYYGTADSKIAVAVKE